MLVGLILLLLASLTPGAGEAQAQTIDAGISVKTVIEVSSVDELRSVLHSADANRGLTIEVLPGRYEIDRPIMIQSDDVTVVGSGAETEFVLADSANCPVFFVGSTEVPAATTYSGVVLSRMKIDGNAAEQDREEWLVEGREWFTNNGITGRNIADCEFRDIIVENCISGGIVLAETCRNVRITQVTASRNVWDGIAWDGTVTLSSISNSTLRDNGGAGLSLDIGPEENVFLNVRMNGNGTSGVFIRDSRNCQFWNCEFKGNAEDGVFVADAECETRGSGGHIFRSCRFLGNTRTGFAQKGDLSTEISVKDSVFKQNGYGPTDLSFPKKAPLRIAARE